MSDKKDANTENNKASDDQTEATQSAAPSSSSKPSSSKERQESSAKKIDKAVAAKSVTPKTQAEPATDNTAQDSQTAKKESAKTGKSRGLSWLLVLVVILAVAAGGYFSWRYISEWQQQGQESTVALHDQLASQNQLISELQTQMSGEIATQREQLAQQQRLIDQLQSRVTSQGSRLKDLSTATREDWLLAEAEYLLRLANQRLLTERSTENPQALLLAADEILKQFNDPDLFAVRKQIASDITALRLASLLDREGLYLQLVALGEVVPKLQLVVTPWEERLQGDSTAVETDASQSWGKRLWGNIKSFFGGLDNYIRINDRAAPAEPLLSPKEESYLRHNLGMMLEQAELALLREEAEIYRTSLQKSRDWLNQYFELNPQATLFQQQLEQLIEQPVGQGMPDISASLEGLRSYINLWHLRHQGPSESAKSVTAEESEL